jgi:hypothetical protein
MPSAQDESPLQMFRNARPHCNDATAMRMFLEGYSLEKVSQLMCYLVSFKGKRDDIARTAFLKQKEKFGVSPSYHYVTSDPDAYERKLERDRQWIAEKRKQKT